MTTAQDSLPLGWCLTGQHDKDAGRGPCPIVTPSSSGPCSCQCHGGDSEPRGFLADGGFSFR